MSGAEIQMCPRQAIRALAANDLNRHKAHPQAVQHEAYDPAYRYHVGGWKMIPQPNKQPHKQELKEFHTLSDLLQLKLGA